MSLIQEDNEQDEKDEISSNLNSSGVEDEANSRSPFAAELGIYCDGEVQEKYYEKMVKEDPSNPLFLRNYGRILQSKGDLQGAEDYYYRAAVMDPKDGKAQFLYAKLMWDCHHDKDRASSFFRKASKAAPKDSEILAAYANFLWNVDEDEENSEEDEHSKVEDTASLLDVHRSAFAEETRPASSPLHLAMGLGINVASLDGSLGTSNYMTTDFDGDANMEEYYRMMAEWNPTNPLYLSIYAEFLCKVKGDLRSAGAYYSRAILADPRNGQILSQYAQLILELYGDTQRASSYFEQAAKAAPNDSTVLGAYARLLWEAKDDDEELNMPVY